MKQTALGLALAGLLFVGLTGGKTPAGPPQESMTMELGAFSVSLAVKDLAASRTFYEELGFAVVGGEAAQNWQILRNGTTTIGPFQGMFEKNIMTFHPGWNAAAEPLESFADLREIQALLDERGVELKTRADASTKSPASIVLLDPNGNMILVDQHVPRKT